MLADEIRDVTFTRFIQPARARGAAEVTIVAGEVADVMDLKDRMPAVCGAIGADKFQHQYRVALIARKGPQSGRSTAFTFRV